MWKEIKDVISLVIKGLDFDKILIDYFRNDN